MLGEVVDDAGGKQSRTPRATACAGAVAVDIEQLAEWIATARAPVVITGLLGQDPRDAVVLSRLAERWALPVIPYNTRYFAISANHPMFQGSMPGPLLDEADLVIVHRIRRAVDAEQGSAAGPARGSCRSARIRSTRAIRCAASHPI